jgi:NADPH:quinone reductase
MMQAVYLENAKLNYGLVKKPILQAGELLLKVAYAGVNHADLLQVAGRYPAPNSTPAVLGLEVSGVVVEIGVGVHGFAAGDKVCALLTEGGYSEYVTVDAAHCFQLSEQFPLEQAAALPEALMTAQLALCQTAQIQYGENLLIHGGASGVGFVAAQMVHMLGINVYVTASDAKKIAHLEQYFTVLNCATPVGLLREAEDLRFDVILDILGGDFAAVNLKLLRLNGRMVSIACMGGSDAQINIASLLMKNLSWYGVTLRSQPNHRKSSMIQEIKQNIWRFVVDGSIKPHIHAIFPLKDAEKAHDLMRSRTHIGKILLEVLP